MATQERERLLGPGEQSDGAIPPFAPPAYDQPETSKDHEGSKPLPLPTYDQSEKYEKNGVLEYTPEQVVVIGTGEVTETPQQLVGDDLSRYNKGTLCEFIVFFIVCALFSVFGFVFAFCVAWTVAAQSGALAGLGVAFISKPLMFELQPEYMTSLLKENYCYSYIDTDQLVTCMQRGYAIVRLFLWLLGMFGLYLLLKGTSTYVRVWRASRSN